MKNLDLLIPQKHVEKDAYLWATVTATSPLRIRLDGETEPLDFTPDALIRETTVGARVWCQMHGRRLIVIGSAGGPPAPPTPNNTGWITPTCENGWAAQTGLGVTPGAYRRLNGAVHFRGNIKGGTVGSTMFTLPAEFRPATNLAFPVAHSTGVGRCNVFSNGKVTADAPSELVALNGIYYTLD